MKGVSTMSDYITKETFEQMEKRIDDKFELIR